MRQPSTSTLLSSSSSRAHRTDFLDVVKTKKTGMGRKTIVWMLQSTNRGICTRKDLDIFKKGKPQKKKN